MRFRLIVALLIISLLPLILLGYFSYQQSSGIIESETRKLTDQLVGESHKVLDRQLNEIAQVSTTLVTNDRLIDLLNTEPSKDEYENYMRQADIQDILRNVTVTRSDIETVAVINDAGEVISTGSMVQGEEKPHEEEWFQEAIEADGKLVWFPTQQESFVPGGQQGWTYKLARSMSSFTRGANYVLVMEVRESSLSVPLKEMEINETGTLRIVDSAGSVVSSLDEEELGTTEASKDYTFLKDEEAGSLVTDDQLISYAPIGSAGWHFVMEVPMAAMLEQVNRIRTFTFVIVAISAVAALIVALFIGRQLARPIEQMRGVMGLAGEGDLTAKADIRGKDEIAQLNSSYMELIGRFRNFVGRTKDAGNDLYAMAQDLIKQAEQNNVAYREITEATESIATGADEQAREAENSAELVGELLSKWRESLGEAETLERVMDETLRVSEHGQTSVGELQEKNELTEQEIERLSGNLQELEDRVDEVHRAANLIDGIMDQTKILALNAAIEAHRAGQEGRGFLVVADEVQRLSEQVLSATNTIGSSIDSIQKAMKSTWHGMKLTNEAMELQRETVKGTDEAFQRIQSQMDEAQAQLKSVMDTLSHVQQFEQRMSDAIQNISAVAQQSAAATEEVAALAKDQEGSSDHLVDQSHALGEIVQTLEEELSQFRVEEGTDEAASSILDDDKRTETVAPTEGQEESPVIEAETVTTENESREFDIPVDVETVAKNGDTEPEAEDTNQVVADTKHEEGDVRQEEEDTEPETEDRNQEVADTEQEEDDVKREEKDAESEDEDTHRVVEDMEQEDNMK